MNPVFTLFFCVFAHALAGPATTVRRYLVKEEDPYRTKFLLVERNGKIEIEDLVNAPIQARAEREDVLFYLYSQSNQNGILLQNCDDLGAINSEVFDSSRTTVVIIHGWNNDYSSSVNSLIKAAFLEKYNVNVIVTDWGSIANRNYITASNAVVDVGGFVANLLSNLVNTRGLSLNNVIIVGHSLGAHVAGNAGATLNGQVQRIIGLDPAGPLFSVDNTDNRLDPSDGNIVEAIHTSGWLLGFGSAIAQRDYFPNGGITQPGCGLDLAGTCAHSRSYEYFSESVLTNSFVSEKCTSYEDYLQGLCNTNPTSLMGGYQIQTNPEGEYYLDTNSQSPFAIGS